MFRFELIFGEFVQIPDCPQCKDPMQPLVVTCAKCKVEIRADFEPTEFSRLTLEALHFLRIFVHCEGRIKDMERALGVSYPTIKNRLAHLKQQLGLDPDVVNSQPVVKPSVSTVEKQILEEQNGAKNISDIVRDVERGKIPVAEALRSIQQMAKDK